MLVDAELVRKRCGRCAMDPQEVNSRRPGRICVTRVFGPKGVCQAYRRDAHVDGPLQRANLEGWRQEWPRCTVPAHDTLHGCLMRSRADLCA